MRCFPAVFSAIHLYKRNALFTLLQKGCQMQLFCHWRNTKICSGLACLYRWTDTGRSASSCVCSFTFVSKKRFVNHEPIPTSPTGSCSKWPVCAFSSPLLYGPLGIHVANHKLLTNQFTNRLDWAFESEPNQDDLKSPAAGTLIKRAFLSWPTHLGTCDFVLIVGW